MKPVRPPARIPPFLVDAFHPTQKMKKLRKKIGTTVEKLRSRRTPSGSRPGTPQLPHRQEQAEQDVLAQPALRAESNAPLPLNVPSSSSQHARTSRETDTQPTPLPGSDQAPSSSENPKRRSWHKEEVLGGVLKALGLMKTMSGILPVLGPLGTVAEVLTTGVETYQVSAISRAKLFCSSDVRFSTDASFER